MVSFLRAMGEIVGGYIPAYSPNLISAQGLIVLISFIVLSSFRNRQVVVTGGKVLSNGLSRLPLSAVIASSFLLMALLAWFEPPTPVVHDEFSYLLAADTFASGRLTNPSHPKAEFFETFHVLMHPTYQSKYMPAQGLVLALGQKFFHYPIVGVWIFLCLGIAAAYWMLLGWFHRRWAMLGAVLTAYLVVFSDISQTFYFNPCAFLGGVLVLGAGKRMAVPATFRRQPIASGAIWGIGAGLLLLSRPFEGFFLCLAIIGWVIWNTPFRQAERLRGFLLSQASAITLVSGFVAFLLYYNRAVTGDAWVFPYSLHDQRYLPFPVILWFPYSNIASWPNSVLEDFYAGTLADFIKVDWQLESFTHLSAATYKKLECFFTFYPNLALTPVAFIGLRALWRSRDRVLSAGMVPAGLFVIASTSCWVGSYGIHLIGPLVLCSVLGFRSLFTWHRSYQREGARLAFSLLLAVLISYPLVFSLRRCFGGVWYQAMDSFREVNQTLDQIPGKIVLFVSYEDTDMANTDWVYNPADIDSARVVWARDLGKKKNQELVDYYGDREKVTMRIGVGQHPDTDREVPTYTLKHWPREANSEAATDSLSVHK